MWPLRYGVVDVLVVDEVVDDELVLVDVDVLVEVVVKVVVEGGGVAKIKTWELSYKNVPRFFEPVIKLLIG